MACAHSIRIQSLVAADKVLAKAAAIEEIAVIDPEAARN